MNDLNHARTLAASRILMQAPECARSRCTLHTIPIPQGLRPSAQGCEERATLGKGSTEAPTLKGLRQADAIIAAVESGAQVLVTNGSYRPVVGTNGPVQGSGLVPVRSVNGPLFTVINGGHSSRCVYLGGSATLTGFTLTNGFAYYYGGGA